MRGRQSRERGFTLIETVVTVGIVAALAAVVYPQVVKQFDTADPTRVAEDLKSIQTGIEVFSLNVKPHRPHDIEDLVNRPQSSASAFDSTATGSRYSATDTVNWNGPYIGLSIPNATLGNATVTTTGFGGTIHSEFARFDVDAATGGTITTMGDVATAEFLAVRIDNLSNAAFNAINELIDGPSEADDDARRWTGRLRCPGAYTAGTPCAAAYFLAVPIR